MILNYDNFNNRPYKNYETMESEKAKYVLDEIKLRQERKKKKDKLIEELNYEKDLITHDIINIIRSDLTYTKYNLFVGYNQEMFSKAWRYINLRKDADKEVKKDYKKSFDFVTHIIEENILSGNKDFKLKEIYDYNFSQAYEFIYEYKDHKFSISIPMFANTNEKNYLQMLYGYRISHYESKHTSMQIIYGLDYTKVANDFKQWLEDNIKECE
jgi:hypothetical protein